MNFQQRRQINEALHRLGQATKHEVRIGKPSAKQGSSDKKIHYICNRWHYEDAMALLRKTVEE